MARLWLRSPSGSGGGAACDEAALQALQVDLAATTWSSRASTASIRRATADTCWCRRRAGSRCSTPARGEQPHGDHSHFYTAEPTLTDVVYDATTPGHVVTHAGLTVLFDDGTGTVATAASAEVADADAAVETFTTPHPHHGVAVELTDGTVVVTEGTEEERTGIRVLDADGTDIASNDQCPGVHCEAVAADEVVVVGCTDGVLLYTDGQITKIDSPDEYGRIGNQWGLEDSASVVGDYRAEEGAVADSDARISLIDTESGELQLVQVPSSYWYRSVGRGENGEAVVLGTDGSLHVIDTATGTVTGSYPVIDAWEVSENWQDPQPQVFTMDGTAFVTDPAAQQVHAVDIETGEVWATGELDVVPNELKGVTAEAEATSEDEHDH